MSETWNDLRTTLASSSDTEADAKSRREVNVALNGPGGAWNGSTAALRSCVSANRASRGAARSASIPTRAARTGVVATDRDDAASRPSSAPRCGRTSRANSGRSSGASASTSKMIDAYSAPRTPSMHAWWIFSSRATPPSSRPSSRQSSQSGRERSSGCSRIVPTSRPSSCARPGQSTVASCTCASTSSSGMSSQTGRSRRPGISTIRRRNRPRCASRPVTSRRTCSGPRRAAESAPANTASTPLCICHSRDSAARKAASVRLSRCTRGAARSEGVDRVLIGRPPLPRP